MHIKKILIIILILPLYVMLLVQSVFSHPHVKIISTITFEFNGTTCEGCRVQWMFDDYFSASMINDFDKNRDGIFDDRELNDLYNGGFINLKNYGFFVFLRKGSERSNPERVSDFNAWQNDRKLFYSFYISFKDQRYSDDFYLAVFDRSFYCAAYYSNPAVIINQKKGGMPVYEITRNKKYPVYYNPAGAADDMTIYKKWKPGLETAYPEEIHIYFRK